MTTSTKPKRDYQENLRYRVARFCHDYNIEPDVVEPFYQLVREEALQSWKNGKTAAPRSRGRGNGPSVTTSAIREGKLTPKA